MLIKKGVSYMHLDNHSIDIVCALVITPRIVPTLCSSSLRNFQYQFSCKYFHLIPYQQHSVPFYFLSIIIMSNTAFYSSPTHHSLIIIAFIVIILNSLNSHRMMLLLLISTLLYLQPHKNNLLAPLHVSPISTLACHSEHY